MGYADKYYYGQNKLIVNNPSGGEVTVTDGKTTWALTGSKVTFMLPNTNKYVVTTGSKRQEVFMGYGDCKEITI